MITACVCASFKRDVLATVARDVFMVALYPAGATLSKTTTAYRASDEAAGAGYAPGGAVLAGVTVLLEGDAAVLSWADPIWPVATITARGALIYNASKSNKAVAVLDFGEDVTSTNGPFRVALPSPVVRLT